MWEQPRSRGEHTNRLSHRARSLGTAPLARGALGRATRHRRRRGNSPARAGSTARLSVVSVGQREQPRSRGEHIVVTPGYRTAGGTAPLARGAHLALRPLLRRVGNSPARAGSTGSAPNSQSPTWEQPRSRGEHAAGQRPSQSSWGTAPLARGALPRRRRRHPGQGNSPARAGSTAPSTSPISGAREQPRSRGEHSPTHSTGGTSRGTAPLARGALGAHRAPRGAAGNSPARAGSTTTCWSCWASCWEQPRSRGEHARPHRF